MPSDLHSFPSSLFSQAIELIDRPAGRLGQITEIEIGCDLVAHIRFGEAELWPLPSDVDRSLYVDAVFQSGVLQRFIDDVLADAGVLHCDFNRLIAILQVVFLGIEVRFEEIYRGLAVLQKVAVCTEQLISAAKLGSRGNIATRWVIGVPLDNAAIDRR